MRILLLTLLAFVCTKSYAQKRNIQQVDLALLKSDYLKAIEICNTFATGNTSSALQYRKAFALRQMYKYSEALTSITKAVELEPNNKHFLIEYGRILLLNNQVDSAKNTFKYVKQAIDSNDVSNYILLAKIYEKEKKWKEMESIYSSLSKLDESNSYFRYKHAATLTKQKRGKEAIPIIQTNLLQDPNHIKSRHLLFKIYRALEQLDNALIHMDTLKTIDSLNSLWYKECGDLHANRNHNYLALAQYKKALKLGNTTPETKIAIGTCLYKIKKFNEAIPFLRSNGEIESNAKTLYEIADAYEKINKTDSAKIFYKRSINMALPNAFTAQSIIEGLALIDIEEKNYNKAIERYETLINMYKDSQFKNYIYKTNIRAIAEIYEGKLKNLKKALEIYKKELTQVSEYNNPHLFKYYTDKVEKLNEQLFFEGNN